ncbi:ATP-binding protein [Kineosporia sp. J2-2]|uniref:ATP-binding protein n=1 Tax=Kineosporia corallincola TaxID=2835133 RepID=A0ABS5TPG0_9ACTN|nr:ATP-binding protein [Kineosporia corallincola]MBT0772885.1 ATP-binding protein [Kineosporia corallincola]
MAELVEAGPISGPLPEPLSHPGQDLLERLDLLYGRVAGLVRHRSSGDPTADDPLRGMVLSAEAVGHLLGRAAEPTGQDDAYGLAVTRGRLLRLTERFGLLLLDLHILVAALAPDVDPRFGPLYGYLNDNVSQQRATVNLALDLAGLAAHQAVARARLYPDAPLLTGGLVTLDDEPAKPFPAKALRVPERVIGHLLGDDTPDAALLGSVEVLTPGPRPGLHPQAARLGRLLRDDLRDGAGHDGPGHDGVGHPVVVHLHESRPGAGARELAAAALHDAGLTAVVLDLRAGAEDDQAGGDPVAPATAIAREARLRGAGIVAGPLPPRPGAAAVLVRELERSGVPTLFYGPEPFDPAWSVTGGVLATRASGTEAADVQRWIDEIGSAAAGIDVGAAISGYRIGPAQVRATVRAARALAALDGHELTGRHLQLAARQRSAPMLQRHARRITPGVGWADLVLPAEPLAALRELVVRARQRDRVLGEWLMRSGGGRGRGVVALFAGGSGTGKTMSAEVVAADLGMDLYVVDLSTVVDKYIGETEKNLERIFSEADRTDAVLLFDEADAVFGKRSEVKDSHDKHANMQSAYLLQRLEQFDGLAVLTTNLRANIDEAFTRRLDLVVDFPFPDADQRARLWRHCLAVAPQASDLELEPLAARFELSGGAIHSAAVTAAYLAAGRDDVVTTADLWTGAEREYRKMGRLVPRP